MIPWVWLALGCSGAEEAAPTEAVVASALDDDAFRFCHVPGAEAEASQEWCDLVAQLPEDRCPGLHATCAGVVAEDPVYARGCDEEEGGGTPDRLAGEPERPPDEKKGCEAPTVEGLGSLMRWVMAIAVAVAVLVLFRILWATFGGRRRRDDVLPPPPVEDGTDDAPLPDVPDVPAADLLDAARAALAAGRTGDAVLLARGAALRRLGEAGRLRLHRSRTDREYVRSLRREAELQRDLRAVVGAVEMHRWGGDPVGVDLARSALAAAERLLKGVATVALLLWVRPAQAQTPERYAPDGDAGLVEVLNLHGYDAGWRLRSLEDLDETTDALWVDVTAVYPTDEQWEHVRAWVEAGGVLVVAGDASVPFPELGDRLGVSGGRAVAAGPLVGSGTPAPRFDGGPVFVYDGCEPWVVDSDDGGGVVVACGVGEGVLVGIADPRLVWNGSFAHPDNEAFVGDLLYLGQGLRNWPIPTPARVQLATTAAAAAPSSSQGANPLASMANARLLLFVLQLLATWLLLGLWRGWPFAPLRDPPNEGRLDFSEHIVALGTRWFRLKASRHAAVRTASLWLARLGPSGLQLAAERAGRTPEQARAWVDGVVALVAEPDGPDGPADLDLVEELWRVTSRR